MRSVFTPQGPLIFDRDGRQFFSFYLKEKREPSLGITSLVSVVCAQSLLSLLVFEAFNEPPHKKKKIVVRIFE